jgi:hypothetical protein
MPGAQTFLACFVIPFLWPAAAGHVLFWAGSVLLALRRWRGAAVVGLLSLAVSLVMAVLLWPAYVGMYCKLLAMTVLGVSAIGAAAADAKKRAESGAAADLTRDTQLRVL